MGRKFPEGNQRGQRSDQRAGAADVHAPQQSGILVGELRKQNRRGHVADKLAGKHRRQQRILSQKAGKEGTHGGQAAHVARKNKEAHKRSQQAVIHHGQRFSIQNQKPRRHGGQHQPDGQQPENHEDRHQEQRQVQAGSHGRQPVFPAVADPQSVGLDQKAAARHQRNRHHKGPEHNGKEFSGGNLKVRIQIQILRVAEGRQHAAQIGGNILKNEDQRYIPFFSDGGEHQIPQRQERNQRHIVSNQHGTDEGDVAQSDSRRAGVARQADDLPGQYGEEVNVLQSADHSQRTEQAAQGFPVEIPGVLRVRRHQKGRNDRRAESDQQYGVLTHKRLHVLKFRFLNSFGCLHGSFRPAFPKIKRGL